VKQGACGCDDATKTSALEVERARNVVVDWDLANTPVATVSTAQNPSSSTLIGGSSTSDLHLAFDGNILCWGGTNVTSMPLSLTPLIEQELVYVYGSQMAALCWQKLRCIFASFR